MKIVKLISVLLAVLMMAGTLTVVAGAEGVSEPKYTTSTGNGKSNMKEDPSSKTNDKVDKYRYKWGEYVVFDEALGKEVTKVIRIAGCGVLVARRCVQRRSRIKIKIHRRDLVY